MRLKLVVVLGVALAIELINFFFLGAPIDVGYPPETPFYIQLIGLQWVVLHLAGLSSLDWFEKVFGCYQPNVAGSCQQVDRIVLFTSGYLTTLLLVFGVMYVVRYISRLRRTTAQP